MASEDVTSLKNVQRRVHEVLAKHGLLPHATTFVVDPHVGMQTIVVNDPDFRPPDPVLDELEAIQKATEADERARAQDADAEKARRDLIGLKDQLKRPDQGIL